MAGRDDAWQHGRETDDKSVMLQWSGRDGNADGFSSPMHPHQIPTPDTHLGQRWTRTQGHGGESRCPLLPCPEIINDDNGYLIRRADAWPRLRGRLQTAMQPDVESCPRPPLHRGTNAESLTIRRTSNSVQTALANPAFVAMRELTKSLPALSSRLLDVCARPPARLPACLRRRRVSTPTRPSEVCAFEPSGSSLRAGSLRSDWPIPLSPVRVCMAEEKTRTLRRGAVCFEACERLPILFSRINSV